MQAIFDKLRQLFGGKLTQQQVDAANQVIAASSATAVASMLGVQGMRTSRHGIDLICSFEGYRDKAYDDGVGVWTIGYGTTRYPNGISVKKGDTCTMAQAKLYMQNDLANFEAAVNEVVNVPLLQDMFDALVSLTYNIGIGAFKGSTLLKKLNAGDTVGAADQFLVWNKAGRKVMQGLVNRRKAERAKFCGQL